MRGQELGNTGENVTPGLLDLNKAELAELKRLSSVRGSLLEASEINLLRIIRVRGGIDLMQAIMVEEHYPRYFDFGTGWDGMKALQKYTDLGFIHYDRGLNKWVPSPNL